MRHGVPDAIFLRDEGVAVDAGSVREQLVVDGVGLGVDGGLDLVLLDEVVLSVRRFHLIVVAWDKGICWNLWRHGDGVVGSGGGVGINGCRALTRRQFSRVSIGRLVRVESLPGVSVRF